MYTVIGFALNVRYLLKKYDRFMINVSNVSKVYKIYSRRSDRLREWLLTGGRKYHFEHWALRDVSLTIAKGQVLGIIGMNGAGKSTLLKILTGTTRPTKGTVNIGGRVAALLELGTGFHPEFSGRENVLVNGKLLGLSTEEIESRIEEIKDFSELREYFEQPVRTYSSGMYVRLAFALASSVNPEVFIIDEALSVGDAYFQQKCLQRIREFRERGTTILFVSHDALAIRLLCDQVALMDRGKIIEIGQASDLLEHYNALLARKDVEGREYVMNRGNNSSAMGTISGNLRAKIESVSVKDDLGVSVNALTVGAFFRVEVEVKFADALDNPTVGILIRDRLGYDVFGTNTFEMGTSIGNYSSGQTARIIFSGKANFGPGSYTVTAAIHADQTHIGECFQWVDRILTFTVLPRADVRFLGVSYIEPKVSVVSH